MYRPVPVTFSLPSCRMNPAGAVSTVATEPLLRSPRASYGEGGPRCHRRARSYLPAAASGWLRNSDATSTASVRWPPRGCGARRDRIAARPTVTCARKGRSSVDTNRRALLSWRARARRGEPSSSRRPTHSTRARERSGNRPEAQQGRREGRERRCDPLQPRRDRVDIRRVDRAEEQQGQMQLIVGRGPEATDRRQRVEGPNDRRPSAWRRAPPRRRAARGRSSSRQRRGRQWHALQVSPQEIEARLLGPAADPVALAACEEPARVATPSATIATQIVPGSAPSCGSGPAAPVNASATSASNTRRAPDAIAGARLADRAAGQHVARPRAHAVSSRPRTRPRNRGTTPTRRHRGQPLPTPPPVSDSAHARVRPRTPAAAAPSPPATRRREKIMSPSRARTSATSGAATHRRRRWSTPSPSAEPSLPPSTRGRRRRVRGGAKRSASRSATADSPSPATRRTRETITSPPSARAARAGSCRRSSPASRRGRRASRTGACRRADDQPRRRPSVGHDPARALGHGGLPQVAFGHRTSADHRRNF